MDRYKLVIARAALFGAVLMLSCAAPCAAPGKETKQAMSFEQFWADAQKANKADKSPASIEKMKWWREARLGMFIHCDMSSLVGGEISWCQDFYALGKQRPNTTGGGDGNLLMNIDRRHTAR